MADAIILRTDYGEIRRESYIVEFFPSTPDEGEIDESRGGMLVVRTNTYASTVEHFKNLLGVMQDIGATCVPPLVIDASYPSVVHFGGKRTKGTYGLEARVPANTVVPQSVRRISQLDQTLA